MYRCQLADNEMRKVLIVAPSLDVEKNVSGISAVVNFIIANNREYEYVHFMQGKSDNEKGGLERVKRLLKNYRRWTALMKTSDDFIIHYSFPLDAFSVIRDYFFMRAAYRLDRKMLVHVHGGLYLFREDKPFIIQWLLNKVFSWEVPIVVLSEKEKQHIQQNYHTKNITVLPNTVDLSVAASYHKEISSNKLDILYLGRIEPNKGMDYLLDAMKSLKEKQMDFTLHFAGAEQGGTEYVEKFSHLLGNQFVYEGVVMGEKKTALFKQCQVFILPSLFEGLPVSLLECMSFGLVPVVTNVGSISEYVKDKENGLFLKVKDVNSIIQALDILSNDKSMVKKMSVAARQTIFEQLRPEAYVSKLNNLYAGLG